MITFGPSSDLKGLFHVHKLDTKLSLFELFTALYNVYDKIFILESLVGPKELSEMSIIGFDPDLTINCNSYNFSIYDRNNRLIKKFKVKEPLSCLKKIVPKINESRFRYTGGAVGYISYDAVRFWERLPIKGKGKKHFPLLEFGIYTDGLLYDHVKNQAYYFYIGDKSRLPAIEEITHKTEINNAAAFSYSIPKSNLNRSQFTKIVNRSKKYIRDGDVFQVVLSKKMKFNVKGNLLSVYKCLREINPSPYMYLLKMANR